jgi:hypothetical protein
MPIANHTITLMNGLCTGLSWYLSVRAGIQIDVMMLVAAAAVAALAAA